MKFSYKARTKEGKMQTGIIEAYSQEAAMIALQKANFFITAIKEEHDADSLFDALIFARRIAKKDLVIFFRELSIMLQSQVPVVQSIKSLAEQSGNGNFKEVLQKVATLVEEGISLSQALSAYPKIFDEFHINLIKSGEVSGRISEALLYISENLEREDDINSQVRQAMMYPVFLVAFLVIVIVIIITMVMPRIGDLIKESGGTPSTFTLITLQVSWFLQNYWWAVVLALVIIISALGYYLTTKSGKRLYDTWSLKIPLIGSILKKVFLARFCGNVATLLVSGISINKALKIAENTVSNVLYRDMIVEIGKDVSEGEKTSTAMLKYPKYFPLFAVQIVKVGEETGKLDKSLTEIVNFYQKDIQRGIDTFTSFLGPIMIVFLGGIVALLAVSVLSSLYSAIGSI